MGERQALRIDYAHGTVPGTAFVIDEPFPIPPCGPRAPPEGAGGGMWPEAPPHQGGLPLRDEAPWERRDWAAPRFPDFGEGGGGRFRQDEGRRPNGSYQRGPFGGGPRGGGRGRGGDLEDAAGGFRGGRGMRPGMGGGFRGRGGDRGRGGRGGEHTDGGFRGRGGPGGRGRGGETDGGFRGRGGRGRGGVATEEADGGFRGRGGFGGRGRGGAGAEGADGGFRGRGGFGGRGSFGGRGRGGAEEADGGFRGRGGFGGRGRGGAAAEESDGAFRGRGGLQRGARGQRGGAPAGGPRGRGRGAMDGSVQQTGKPFTPKPVPKHATPGKILTSMIPPLVKRPPVSKFRNRFPDSDESSRSPSPKDRSRSPMGKGKSGSPGAKTVTSGTKNSDATSKTTDTDENTKSKSPAKEGDDKRSPAKSSSRTRSPGKKSSRTRSSSKSRSRRSRSRSRRRSRSRSRRRSRSRSRRRSRSRSRRRSRSSGRRAHSKSHSPRRAYSPRVTRSPYRPLVQIPGQEEEGFGVRVQGFPTRSSDRTIQDGLYHEFKRYGKIISVDMHGCAEDRFAVVLYQQISEREKALASFKGHCFFGRPVQMEPWDAAAGGTDRSWDNNVSFRPLDERADEYHPRATKILFVGNLEKTLTREDLSTIFQRYGEILGIDLKKMVGLPNRFAFIQYIDIASVCRAIKEMDGELLRNTRLRLGFGRSKPTNCVWVDGLPETLTEEQLTAHFSAHGTVLKLSFDAVKGVALVFFKTVEQAEAALKEARGQTVAGKRIKVDFANSRSQAAFFRVSEPAPEVGVDADEEEKPPAPPFQEFKPSEIEAGDVLRKVLLV